MSKFKKVVFQVLWWGSMSGFLLPFVLKAEVVDKKTVITGYYERKPANRSWAALNIQPTKSMFLVEGFASLTVGRDNVRTGVVKDFGVFSNGEMIVKESEDCRLKLTWVGRELVVEENQLGCAGGLGVTFNGRYLRKSAPKKNFQQELGM